jgi:hypothetical protein
MVPRPQDPGSFDHPAAAARRSQYSPQRALHAGGEVVAEASQHVVAGGVHGLAQSSCVSRRDVFDDPLADDGRIEVRFLERIRGTRDNFHHVRYVARLVKRHVLPSQELHLAASHPRQQDGHEHSTLGF